MSRPTRSWLKPPKVRLGIDILLESRRKLLHGKRVGVITNQTGLTWDLKHMIDLFVEADDIDLVALYGPEHGIYGEVRWGEEIDSGIDPRTGLPIYSLYGEHRKPTPEMLEGVDVLVFNIQDVGARFYTYGSTMALCMQAAAESGVEFIVLDRPNPITGVKIEGNILDPAYSSFVGLYPVAIRHGLTLGELAKMVNQAFGVSCDLTVVEMEGWQRSMWFDQTSLPFVMTSWGTASLSKTVVYPGSCFFEGTNVALGLGTLKPCELKGAPWIDGHAWADALNALDYPGVIFRAAYFTPWYGDYLGEVCSGVQIHVLDREIYKAVQTGLKMIEVVRQMYPDRFEWKRSEKGFAAYWFDQLMGTDRVRLQMEAGVSTEEITAAWESDLKAFDDLRQRYLLY